MTSIDRNSKPDTVFLALPDGAGVNALAADLSQYRTDLTVTSNWASEVPSPRTGLAAVREVAIVIDLTNSDDAVLLLHGDGTVASNTYYVRIASGSAIFAENGGSIATVPLPGVSASEKTFLLHWSTRPEGGSSRSECYVVNLTDGVSTIVQATHAVATTDESWGLYVNGSHAVNGLDAARWRSLRVGRRFHSTAEAREDWVAQRTPPVTTQVRRDAVLVPHRKSLDLAADGAFAGPAYLWSGHAFEHGDRRLLGPLVNLRVLSPLEISKAFQDPITAWWRAAPGDPDYKIAITHLWRRPVPGKVNRAHCRLFVRQEGDGGATAEVRYRVYSIAGLPVVGQPIGPLKYHRTAAGTCTTDHADAGVEGEWLDLGALALAVDDRGFTWLAVAVDFDDDSELIEDTTARILAVCIDPYFEPPGGGALDIAEP
ncbi:MAG TPA: hypothetical protein VIK91_12480 [Nannocystis sp.]